MTFIITFKNKFQRTKPFYRLIFSLLFVFIFLAYVDLQYDDTFRASTVFKEYVGLFWMLTYGLIIFEAYVYYSATKDKSETIGLVVAFFILLQTWLEDVLYYLIKIKTLPSSMPHLFQHPVMGKIASLMGYSTVTPTSLIVSLTIGIIVTYYVVKYLRRI